MQSEVIRCNQRSSEAILIAHAQAHERHGRLVEAKRRDGRAHSARRDEHVLV
jgi:hypothetical protein